MAEPACALMAAPSHDQSYFLCASVVTHTQFIGANGWSFHPTCQDCFLLPFLQQAGLQVPQLHN
jgi:hypothetical protein